MRYSKLPRPIEYDRKCGRLTTRFQPCSIIYALSPWRDRNKRSILFNDDFNSENPLEVFSKSAVVHLWHIVFFVAKY